MNLLSEFLRKYFSITRLKSLHEDSPKTTLQLDDNCMLDYFLVTKLSKRQQKAITKNNI